MEFRQLGNSTLNVSSLAMGTMTFGEQNDEQQAHQLLDMAVANGINFIDTAEMYPIPPRGETQGLTEQYIGSWLASGRHPRDQLIIASKVVGPSRGFDWIRENPRISREQVNQAVEQSLQRLQTDYIDLYQIHWPDRYVPMFGANSYDLEQERDATPISEQLSILEELIKAGKIRYIGISNETPWGLTEFCHCAELFNLPKIVSIQNAYNLVNRTFEKGLAECCRYTDTGLLAYSPLASGWLTGKYHDNPEAPGRVTRFPNWGGRYKNDNTYQAVQAYIDLARQAGMQPAAMALAFIRSRWFTKSVILGATSTQQLEQNINGAFIDLSDDLIAEINQIHQRYPDPAP